MIRPMKEKKGEKPKALGDRVFKRHRKQRDAIALYFKITKAEAIQRAIENLYEVIVI